MNDTSLDAGAAPAGQPPRGLILAVTSALSLLILAGALYTFAVLGRLHDDYLLHRGHEIASAIESQVRGPGRRNNPEFWQSIFNDSFEIYSRSAAFLCLVDRSGNVLASKGLPPAGLSKNKGEAVIFHFEEMLSPPRNPHSEPGTSTAGWRIRIGLYSAGADFIRQIAFLQLFISLFAVGALAGLSIYLAHMIRRFVGLKAREAAEAQLKSLGMMAASLAHEIRNPLGAMKGLTQLAQEDMPADHQAQTRLRTVVSEAERLEKLVTDLLDFARVKKPKISEFNPMHLLSDIRSMLQPKLDESGVVLQFSIDPELASLRSDPAGLRQVLLNVLLNAVEATPPRKVVALTIAREIDHKSIVIHVDDSGAGLGERKQEELFQPFATTKTRGTGLGLAVSRKIIESLGGSLSLNNLPQGGARCSIRLPLVPAQLEPGMSQWVR